MFQVRKCLCSNSKLITCFPKASLSMHALNIDITMQLMLPQMDLKMKAAWGGVGGHCDTVLCCEREIYGCQKRKVTKPLQQKTIHLISFQHTQKCLIKTWFGIDFGFLEFRLRFKVQHSSTSLPSLLRASRFPRSSSKLNHNEANLGKPSAHLGWL